jgi:IS5 family transposase
MLRREAEGHQSTFGDLARAARSVPRDHVLLRMKAAADWAAVEQQLAGYYDPREGRPSWPPAVLVRMLVLEHFGDLSDREVSEQVAYNLLYRSFVGLGVDEAVPDDTTLVRFRDRLGEQGVREVFDLLNRQWESRGLIGTERRVLDGSHLWGKVARRSWVSLMREGRTLVVEGLERVDPARGKQLRERYVPPPEEREPRGEEALAVERQRTRELLEEVKEIGDERVRERSRLLEAMLGESDRPVSFVDPDARWGHKGEDKPFCGYKTHEGMDPDSRMVTAVEVVPGNANEAVRTDELLRKDSLGVAPGAVIIGDGLYNNATTVGQVQEAGARGCFSGLKAERISDGFDYDAQADQMICVEKKHSIGKVRVDQGDLYYFSMQDCQQCPRRGQCLSRGEREGKAMPRRRVYLSEVRKAKILAGQAGREWRRQHLRVRGRIEAKFDEQMNRHGLRRARYWGLAKVTVQVLLNVITVNLKRAAKLMGAGAAPIPVAVVGVSV